MKTVKSAEPLSVGEIFYLTGKDACTTMGDYKVRIMNFSPDQEIEVVDVVEWKNYKWGIKPMIAPKKEYEYLAFRVE